jgi:putative ABC transport system permease protein
VLGLGLGAAALRLALAHPKIQGVLTAALDTRRAVEAIGLALALGILGGLLPALRGARMHPSDALRYE